MKKLPLDSTDKEIISSVMDWIDVLAREDYSAAWDQLWHPAEDDHWTPDLMIRSIRSYGAPDDPPEQEYKVSEFGDLRPRNDISRIEDRVRCPYAAAKRYVASVDADLPLNGETSDLTVTIEILEFDKSLVLKLHDIHVM